MNYLLLMMGGSGTRFDSKKPKQFVDVHGKPVFSYIMQKYMSLDCIDGAVVVCHKDWSEYARAQIIKISNGKKYSVVHGGDTRSESVLRGLRELLNIAKPEDLVLVHDATHPYVDVDGVKKIIDKVDIGIGITLGAREFDTMYHFNEEGIIQNVVPRESIVSGASPEAFRLDDLSEAYFKASPKELSSATSAAALALKKGLRVDVVSTDLINLKITHKQDMEVFEKLFYGYYF